MKFAFRVVLGMFVAALLLLSLPQIPTGSIGGGGGGGGGDTITSPNSSMTIGGTATNTTIDISTSYGNSLWAQLATANTFCAGCKQTFTPSASTAGLRIVPGAIPSTLTAGDMFVNSGGIVGIYDGSNADAVVSFVGSGAAFGTPPTAGHGMAWGAGYTAVDSGVPTQLFKTNPQSSTYTTTAADFLGCQTIPVASGAFTITLVASGSQPANGQCVDIINYGTGVVTIARNGQNLNGGTASLTLTGTGATTPVGAHIVSDGSNYVAALWGAGSSSGGFGRGTGDGNSTASMTLTCTANTANTFKVTLIGNVTSLALSGCSQWYPVTIIWLQDNTGGRTVTGVNATIKGFSSPGTSSNGFSAQTWMYDGAEYLATSVGAINQ